MRKLLLASIFIMITLLSTQEVKADLAFVPFENYHFYSETYGLRSADNPRGDIIDIGFYIPQTDFNTFSKSGIDSSILFTGGSGDGIVINLADLSETPYGVFILPNDILVDYGVTDETHFTILIMQTYSQISGGYAQFFNTNFLITDDLGGFNTATFYVRGEIYAQVPFLLFVKPLPDDPTALEGRIFTEWYLQDGTLFDHTIMYTEPINIFASFRTSLSYIPVAPDVPVDTPSGFNQLLISTGFMTDAGVIIIYSIIVIAVTFLLLKVIPAIFIVIVNMSITAIFIFMGLMPFYAAALLAMVFVMAIMLSVKGGSTNE